MDAAIRIVSLSRFKDSPEKDLLVYWGKWQLGNTIAEVLDDGAHVKVFVITRNRRPQGKVTPPKSVYQ